VALGKSRRGGGDEFGVLMRTRAADGRRMACGHGEVVTEGEAEVRAPRRVERRIAPTCTTAIHPQIHSQIGSAVSGSQWAAGQTGGVRHDCEALSVPCSRVLLALLSAGGRCGARDCESPWAPTDGA
jgi:hypothetical protein